jgi:hypothetical protein
MSGVLDEVLEANRRYRASFGEKGKLALPPARRFAILTCMDARLDPAKFAGLAEGDAHVSGLSSSATNFWARGNFSSFITPTAAWSSLLTK